jgi:Transmembrane amino acid transporter protein
MTTTLLLGTLIGGYHPRHADLRLLWRRRHIWSLSPLAVCAPRTAPPRVLLRHREPHVSPRGRVLRRGDCHQVLRGVHQVRSLFQRDGRTRLCRADVNEWITAGSYLIIIKSLLPNVVASLYHDLTSPDTNPPVWALSGHIWISLVMIVLVPLSFLRRLDSFRHTSYIALFSCGQYLLFLLR